jgi:hypothetical protein
MKNRKTLWITKTALFIALLVTAQLGTAAFGNQFLTGSLVNLLLVLSAMTSGYASGAAVALISPVTAFFLGHGLPTPLILPFIMLGNLVFVLLWRFAGNFKGEPGILKMATAGVVASAVKFGTLYLGIVKVAVPYILSVPVPVAKTLSVMFSFPQLITALIGSAVAIVVIESLRNTKALGQYMA